MEQVAELGDGHDGTVLVILEDEVVEMLGDQVGTFLMITKDHLKVSSEQVGHLDLTDILS